MANRNLDKEMYLVARARLIARGADQPVTGSAYTVRLFDRDFIQDEYLGTASPDANGYVTIEFPSKAMNRGLLEDKLPDFFFVVYKNDTLIFQSQVMENIHLEDVEHYEKGKGEVIDLGTFLIDA